MIQQGTPQEELKMIFNFAINDSEMEVNCYVNQSIQSNDVVSQVLFHAYEIVRSAVDLLAFSTGRGLTLIFEKAIYPDGTVLDVQLQNHQLGPLCTAFTTGKDSNFLSTFGEVTRDRALMIALRDLTETLEDPLREGVNCARAIEALARILAPQEKGSDYRWMNLQQSLNLSKVYLMAITEHSKAPRHGNYLEPSAILSQDVQIRSWTIMNRFLEYKKRGAIPLDISEFPLL